MCIEIFVTNYIKLFRINKAETERMKMMLYPTIEFGISPLTERDGYEHVVTVDTVSSHDTYSRYQTTVENRIYKATMMLKALKIWRK